MFACSVDSDVGRGRAVPIPIWEADWEGAREEVCERSEEGLLFGSISERKSGRGLFGSCCSAKYCEDGRPTSTFVVNRRQKMETNGSYPRSC